MVAKAGLGLIGLSAISIGGVAMTKPGWLGINSEIKWKPLSKDTNFSTESGASGKYNNKFGKKYRNYLVGLNEENKDWWDDSYRKLVEAQIETGNFSVKGSTIKINSGFNKAPSTDQTNPKSLNQVCEDAYKAEPTNVKSNADTSKTEEFNEEHVWKYCSVLGGKPKTINAAKETTPNSGTAKYQENKIGKKEENSLISVFDKDNQKFWEIREKELRGDNSLIEKATISISDSHFNNTDETIRKLCEQAYEKDDPNGSGSNPTKEATKKYCSLEISS